MSDTPRTPESESEPIQPEIVTAESEPPSQVVRAAMVREQWSGPLPPPQVLERYEATLPGSTDRVFTMAEGQEQHRQEMEKAVVQGGLKAQKLGQWQAFIIALVGFIFAAVLILADQTPAGVALIIAELVALAGIFMNARRQQRLERVTKAQLTLFPDEDAQA